MSISEESEHDENEELGDAANSQRWRGVQVPKGYAVTESGVYKSGEGGRHKIASWPVWLDAQGVDGDVLRVRLRWLRRGGDALAEGQRWVEFGEITDSHRLMRLARFGIQATSKNSRDLSELLTRMQAIQLLPEYQLVRRQGWLDENCSAFMLGDQLIDGGRGDVNAEIVREGDAAIVDGLRPNLDADARRRWAVVAREVRAAAPWARFMLSACFAPPLLLPVGVRTHCIHVVGPSGVGKTAGLKLGVAGWGRVDSLFATWDATEIGAASRAVALHDCPYALDEWTLRDARHDDSRQLAYTLAGGVERVRADQTGATRQPRTWRLVVLSTGEVSLISDADTGGQMPRVLEVSADTPLPDALSRQIHSTVALREH